DFIPVNGGGHQGVQRTTEVYHFPDAASSAGDENSQTNTEIASQPDSEVVYECEVCLAILERTLKALLGNASCLVLTATGFASTRNALWLKVIVPTDFIPVNGGGHQGVQGTTEVYHFPDAASSAGDENSQTNTEIASQPVLCPGKVCVCRTPLPDVDGHIKLTKRGVYNKRMNCICTETKHGHGNPCGALAKKNANKCGPCEDKAAKEFGGTQQQGTSPDL